MTRKAMRVELLAWKKKMWWTKKNNSSRTFLSEKLQRDVVVSLEEIDFIYYRRKRESCTPHSTDSREMDWSCSDGSRNFKDSKCPRTSVALRSTWRKRESSSPRTVNPIKLCDTHRLFQTLSAELSRISRGNWSTSTPRCRKIVMLWWPSKRVP